MEVAARALQPLDQFANGPYHEVLFLADVSQNPSLCGECQVSPSGALPLVRQDRWAQPPGRWLCPGGS